MFRNLGLGSDTTVEVLLALEPESSEPEWVPRKVELSEEAKETMIDWSNGLKEGLEAESISPILEGAVAKADAHLLRIALILHVVDSVCDNRQPRQVDEATVERAIRVMDFFLVHNERALLTINRKAKGESRATVLEYVLNKLIRMANNLDAVRLPKQDLWQQVRNRQTLRNTGAFDETLRQLEEMDCLKVHEVKPGKKGGRAKQWVTVNPILLG